MDPCHDIPVRCARDRLIDLLGLGDAYPLTDLTVAAVPPKVVFGGTARVRIDDAQVGVSYQLFDDLDAPLGLAQGLGAQLEIITPAVTKNVTYRLRARKLATLATLAALPAQAARLLDATAQVRVGLDTGLLVRFKDTPPPAVPLLDPSLRDPQPADPRLVAWGASVAVEIEKSQESVEYSLMLDGREVLGTVRIGNHLTISLPTGPVYEDRLIQVRATKRFGATEQQESEPLDARLALKVMANPDLVVSVDGPAVVDHRRPAVIRVATSQASARYQVFARPIADNEFVHDTAAGFGGVVVPVAGQADVRVITPPLSPGWAVPDGFVPIGEGPLPGTGADLLLPLPPLTADTVLIVQALKNHALLAEPPASATLPSALRLSQAAVVLVRPDPLRALTLRVTVAEGRTGRTLQVSGGEPGVYYHCQPVPAGPAPALPAYFHQRDAGNATLNKGIGQLGIEIDFSLASYAVDPTRPGAVDPAGRFPQPPLLDIPAWPVGTRLALRAVRAQTALAAAMAEQALLADVPAARADPTPVKVGEAARIQVTASDPQDHFQLLRNGQPVAAAEGQGGGELSLLSGPLSADTRFELLVTRGPAAGLRVERLVVLDVPVLPDPRLPVAGPAR